MCMRLSIIPAQRYHQNCDCFFISWIVVLCSQCFDNILASLVQLVDFIKTICGSYPSSVILPEQWLFLLLVESFVLCSQCWDIISPWLYMISVSTCWFRLNHVWFQFQLIYLNYGYFFLSVESLFSILNALLLCHPGYIWSLFQLVEFI